MSPPHKHSIWMQSSDPKVVTSCLATIIAWISVKFSRTSTGIGTVLESFGFAGVSDFEFKSEGTQPIKKPDDPDDVAMSLPSIAQTCWG